MIALTLQPIFEGLAQHKWSDAQLTELDSEMARFDFVADYRFAMRGEADLVSTRYFQLSPAPSRPTLESV